MHGYRVMTSVVKVYAECCGSPEEGLWAENQSQINTGYFNHFMELFPEQEESIGVVRQRCPEGSQWIDLVEKNELKVKMKSF